MKKFCLSFVCLIFVAIFLLLPTTSQVCLAKGEDVDLSCKSAVLMEYDSGQTLYAKNEGEKVPVASMVKMMTILLSLEELKDGNVKLDSKITTSETASKMGGSQVFIDPYEQYTFDDLLKSVIMASANDASVALAEYFNGSEKAFVNRMNKKAKELGMKNTHYSNCTGLPAAEQYSTAYDSAILLKEILKHDSYHKYSTIWMDKLIHPSGRETELVNTNKLVRFYDGCDGGKTGSTNEAGCCLGASAKRGDMRLVSVVLGAPNSKSRFNETATLFNYGFNNFRSEKLVDELSAIKTLPVLKGEENSVNVFAKEGFSAVVKKGNNLGFETKIDLPQNLTAKVKSGDVVGMATVTKDGNIIKKIPLIVKNDVKRMSVLGQAKQIVSKW